MLSAVLAAQFLDFDLGSALDHVWEDGLHLVLGADHFGCLRVVAAQVDGVKLALGRTHTAANAAIGIDDAHTAAKAAGRFHFDLLFRECAARVTERLARLRTGERCGHLTRRSVEALRRLAKCRTQADIAALRADIERIGNDIASGAMTYTGLAERFQQFHLRICQCSHSAMLPLTMNTVCEGSIAIWERHLRTAGLESAVNLLTQFADAIERQDGDAAYALLEQGLDRQLAYYQA